MGSRSISFLAQASDGPASIGPRLAAARAEIASPTGALLFVSGSLAQNLERVAEVAKAAWKGIPAVVVPSAGVITERGELEGGPAVSGLVWSAGRATPFGTDDIEEVAALAGGKCATILLFPRPEVGASELATLGRAAPKCCVFGGGTVGRGAIAISATGSLHEGTAAGIVLSSLAPPIVESSAACKLVTPLRAIDSAKEGLVLTIDGSSALDRLSECIPQIKERSATGAQPVVFVALADEGTDAQPRFIVRPIRGVDPDRGAIMIGPDAKEGMRLAFALRDAASARAGVEAAAREVGRLAMGAAPLFAVYLSCAGRGQGLYGAADVEARLLRQRFGDLPIAGMHSAFEIIPWGADSPARIALYTSVLALFRSPS